MSKYLRLDDTGKKKEEAQGINATTGAPDAGKIITTDAQGFIDPSFLLTDETIIREASEALSARDFVNIFDDTTAKARKADASAFGTRAMGIVNDNFLATENAPIFSEGVFGGFVGLTIGEPIFLDATTPGAITQVPPTGTGEVWQKLGEAISATEIRLEIGEAISRV